MGNVSNAPFFVYLPFIAFAFVFFFMLLLKLYIILSTRGLCKGTCGRSRTNTELENTRSRITGIVTHPSVPLPSSNPMYACGVNSTCLFNSYPVDSRRKMPENLPSLFTSGVSPPMLGQCLASTSFSPSPPPYSQHDLYPPVEIPNGSRVQLSRNFAKVTTDIPPVE